jgi:hypothetical protein
MARLLLGVVAALPGVFDVLLQRLAGRSFVAGVLDTLDADEAHVLALLQDAVDARRGGGSRRPVRPRQRDAVAPFELVARLAADTATPGATHGRGPGAGGWKLCWRSWTIGVAFQWLHHVSKCAKARGKHSTSSRSTTARKRTHHRDQSSPITDSITSPRFMVGKLRRRSDSS